MDAGLLAFEAVASFDVSALRRYLEAGGSMRVTATPTEETLLHCAIRNYPEKSSYEPMLELIHAADPGLVNVPDIARNTPLHYAVQFSNIAALKWLLLNGANMWALNAVGELPVQASVRRAADTGGIDNEHARVCATLQLWTQADRATQQSLLAEWREAESAERSAILSRLWHLAAKAIEYKAGDELLAALDRGAAVNESHEVNGRTLLMLGSQGGWLAGVQLLLARGADVNHTDIRTRTALHYVVVPTPTDEHVAILGLLLGAGADPVVDDVGALTVDRGLGWRLRAAASELGRGASGAGASNAPAGDRTGAMPLSRAPGVLAMGVPEAEVDKFDSARESAAPNLRHGFPLQYALAFAEAAPGGKTGRLLARMVTMLKAATEETFRTRPAVAKSLAKRTLRALRALRAFKWTVEIPLMEDGPLVTQRGETTPLVLQRVLARVHSGRGADESHDEVDGVLSELERVVPRQESAVRAEREAAALDAVRARLRVRMPVFVTTSESQRGGIKAEVSREGVVAYIGRVHFADGLWVGVRLVDACAHHDGTWDGKRYFVAPRNCGVFVRPDKVRERE